MKHLILLLAIALVGMTNVFAQPSPGDGTGQESRLLNSTQLNNQKWYYDLDSALANPDKVYKLSLSDQKVKELPAEFGQLKNLQVLNLSNCGLKEIPGSIKDCKNLQMISLYNNKIKYLPSELRELRQLEVLYLGKNKISELPTWLAGFGKLRRFDITQNPITPAEVEAVKRMLPKADITW